LVREGDGVAARVLTSLGVQLPKVRSSDAGKASSLATLD
jgi:hypothetical protein